MDILPYLVGQNIEFLRLHQKDDKKMDRKQLAELVPNGDVSYIGKLERGELNPTLRTLRNVADGLNADLHELFCDRGADTGRQYELLEIFLFHNLPPCGEKPLAAEAFDQIGECLMNKMTLRDMEQGLNAVKRASFFAQPSMLDPQLRQGRPVQMFDLCGIYTYADGSHPVMYPSITSDRKALKALAKKLSRMRPDRERILDILDDFIQEVLDKP